MMTLLQPTSFFDSSFGRIAYGTCGSGPDLVLVHGTPFSSTIWTEIVKLLAHSFRLVWLDLPGFGNSEKYEGQDLRLRAFAGALPQLIRHLKIEKPHLVGHDFGAAAVLGAYLEEGQSAASLTIIDGVVLNPWGTPYSLLVKENQHVFSNLPAYIHLAALAAHVRTAASGSLSQEYEQAFVDPWSGDEGQAAYYRIIAQYDHDYTEKLESLYPSIAIPTLVIWGAKDRWVDITVGQRFSELVRGARFCSVPDAGHLSMIDCPSLVSSTLSGWIVEQTYQTTSTLA